MCDVMYEGEECELWFRSEPRSRKQYSCIQCGRPIVKGERYRRVRWLHDGQWGTHIVHTTCDEIAKYIAFQICEQEVYLLDSPDASLRESVREHMHDHPEVLGMYRDHLRARNQAERGVA